MRQFLSFNKKRHRTKVIYAVASVKVNNNIVSGNSNLCTDSGRCLCPQYNIACSKNNYNADSKNKNQTESRDKAFIGFWGLRPDFFWHYLSPPEESMEWMPD